MTSIAPGTHLDHLLRQTRMHHVQLSSMADVKANIMLTLAAVVTTFSIGYLDDQTLRWPVVVLILFCVATVLFAAYAVMPKLDFDYQPEIKNPDCYNLLIQSHLHTIRTVHSNNKRSVTQMGN
ncbi:MAG: hypothetical protein CL608_09795 [Anaerolineaceae bacterium]|nr:hypothetical protein [Anaerolineaceae bacterium]